jgi:hypothetical protein
MRVCLSYLNFLLRHKFNSKSLYRVLYRISRAIQIYPRKLFSLYSRSFRSKIPFAIILSSVDTYLSAHSHFHIKTPSLPKRSTRVIGEPGLPCWSRKRFLIFFQNSLSFQHTYVVTEVLSSLIEADLTLI